MTPNEAAAATEQVWQRVDATRRDPEYPFVGLVGFGPILLEDTPGENQWALHLSREYDDVSWAGVVRAAVKDAIDREPADWEIVSVTTGLQLALGSAVRPGSCLQRRVDSQPAGPASTAAARVKCRASSRFMLGSAHALAAYGQGWEGDEVHLVRPSAPGPAETLVGWLKSFSAIDYGGSKVSFVDGALVEVAASCTIEEVLCFKDSFGTPADPRANSKVAKCGAVQPFVTHGKVLVVGGCYEVTFPIVVSGKLATVWFKDQFSIQGADASIPFGSSGDSGALVVSDDRDLLPRGLLMSGSALKNEYVANRISRVTSELECTFP